MVSRTQPINIGATKDAILPKVLIKPRPAASAARDINWGGSNQNIDNAADEPIPSTVNLLTILNSICSSGCMRLISVAHRLPSASLHLFKDNFHSAHAGFLMVLITAVKLFREHIPWLLVSWQPFTVNGTFPGGVVMDNRVTLRICCNV